MSVNVLSISEKVEGTFKGRDYLLARLEAKRPEKISVVFSGEKEGFSSFFLKGQRVFQGKTFTLAVPVVWDGEIPHTRKLGVDNANIVFISPKGEVQDNQVGILSRKGKFYLSVQRVFQGKALGDNGKWVFMPTFPRFNFPGLQYNEVWERMGGNKIKITLPKKNGYQSPDWIPADLSEKEGWERGTVEFFNLVSGTGRIYGYNGEVYFVHFSDVLGGTIPEPGDGVYFRPGELVPGKTFKKVRSCKPA